MGRGGEVLEEDGAEAGRVEFPVPGFVLEGVEAEAVGVEVQPFVDGRASHVDDVGHGDGAEAEAAAG